MIEPSPNSPVRIAIAGAAGRMGQALTRIAVATSDLRIVGAAERGDSPALGRDIGEIAGVARLGVPVVAGLSAAAEADVWVDFTTPAATTATLDALAATNVRAAVVGATGLTANDEARIAAHATRIGIVRARNFSLAVNLMLALIEQASARLGEGWDIEIAETHHRRKVDAPSGTALMMGEAAAHGRGASLEQLKTPPYDGVTGPRADGAIGFSVKRQGGVIGDHEASFASDEEILTIGHRALDRAVFARGALAAARWVATRGPGLFSMRDVLDV